MENYFYQCIVEMNINMQILTCHSTAETIYLYNLKNLFGVYLDRDLRRRFENHSSDSLKKKNHLDYHLMEYTNDYVIDLIGQNQTYGHYFC